MEQQRVSSPRTGSARFSSRTSDQLAQYAEIIRPQPNTVRTEPGAALHDLEREGTPPHHLMMTGQQGRPAPTEPPRADGTYQNCFSREGARIYGAEDDRDRPYEYRDRRWQPDETKDIALDEIAAEREPGSAHAP